MNLNEEVELLKNIPLFARIEASRLKLIAFTSQRIHFADGDYLCAQGEVGDAAYIIMKGEADVLVDTPQGQIKVATMKQSDILGEIALLCDVPRTATVRALGDVMTLQIEKESFFRLLEDFPAIAIQLLKELALRLENTTQKLMKASQ